MSYLRNGKDQPFYIFAGAGEDLVFSLLSVPFVIKYRELKKDFNQCLIRVIKTYSKEYPGFLWKPKHWKLLIEALEDFISEYEETIE